MKIEVNKKDLQNALMVIGGVIPKKSSLPVLMNVLLEVKDDNRLHLTGTDTDQMTTQSIPAWKDSKGGAITVPYRTLLALVASFQNDLIELDVDYETVALLMVCARDKVNLKGMQWKEFPVTLAPSHEANFHIHRELMLDMFVPTVLACGTEKDVGRPMLSAVLLEIDKNNEISTVATDGFRLVKSIYDGKDLLSLIRGDTNATDEVSWVIPSRVIKNIIRIARGLKSETIAFAAKNNRLFVELDEHTFYVASLLEGIYPEYLPIIPTSHKMEAALSLTDMVNALKLAKIFSVDAKFTFKDGMVTILGRGEESGDNRIEVTATIEGLEEFVVRLDSTMIYEVLSTFQDQALLVSGNSGKEPMVFFAQNEEDTVSNLFILMPMHLGG